MRTEPGDGYCLLDKAPGLTSFQTLGTVKKALGTKKIGHTGTLDKFASGLLIALGGRYTRLVERFMQGRKEYLAEFAFGSETDTLDPEGSVIARDEPPSEASILQALPSFTGKLLQIPPNYSALHVEGRRAYEVARRGGEMELKPRPVEIEEFRLVSYNDGRGVFSIRCSRGTYVRSLARDLARACGSRAFVGSLRRTASGSFSVEDAVSPEDFLPGMHWKKVDAAVAGEIGLQALLIAGERMGDFLKGRTISDAWFPEFAGKVEDYAVFDPGGEMIGIAIFDGNRWEYGGVFGAEG